MADCVLQLRGLLIQLTGYDHATRKEEVSRLCKDLLDLGQKWPKHPLDDEMKAFDRLCRLLGKFSDQQQKDLVAAFRPLQEDVQRRLGKITADLNSWLGDAPDSEKASPEKLVTVLQAIEAAPHLQWYKQCSGADTKAKFLVALASVLRSVQSESAPLHSHVAGNAQAMALIEKFTSRFFVVPQHGNVLKFWLDGRLKRYNATLWRAAKSAADQFKDDLQVRLVTALRRKASQVPAAGAKARPHLQLELCEWPMVRCPLATAFLDFIAQRGHELGDLGKPELTECPPHSLRPRTLRRLLERLDAFELVDGSGSNGAVHGIVRLRWEAVTALAFKSLGTKPKAGAPTPKAGASNPPESSETSTVAPPSSLVSDARSSSIGAESPGSKAAARPPPRQKLVERPIAWGDARFLLRLVRRGVRAGDEEWCRLWQQFCKQCRIPPDFSQGTVPDKVALGDFVERNMATLRKKEWAKDLLYKADVPVEETQGSVAGESDGENIARKKVSHSSSGSTAGRPSSTSAAVPAERPQVAGVASKTKVADPAAASRTRVVRVRDTSSCSESSSLVEREERRKRKHKDGSKKRKAGLLGYDYLDQMKHLTPEVMMMNQMMGMSMMNQMMQNPLAMMGAAAASMTPYQIQMMSGVKSKADDKTKKLKIEDKRERDNRPPPPPPPVIPVRKDKDLVDPRLNRPVPVERQMDANSAIDTADL